MHLQISVCREFIVFLPFHGQIVGFLSSQFALSIFKILHSQELSGMDRAGESTDDPETSSAVIVVGEVLEGCDDACSICLEEFSDNDPSMETNCKHQFHLHCILEWCHRSASCPMCWQPIRLNDTTSQKLLEDIERERTLKAYKTRDTPAFYHPTFTNYDLHLPRDGREIDLEEHIFQQLAAAASMQSRHHVSLDAQVPVLQSPPQAIRRNGSNVTPANQPIILFEPRNFGGQSSQGSDSLAESSNMQSLESMRRRLNAWSMRYRESISRNTRGWKERLFASNSSIAVLSSEVQREVNSRICGLSRMMGRLDSRMNNGYGYSSESSHAGRNPPGMAPQMRDEIRS